jgi:nucleoside-diphosphate-sugar epimerase
MSRCSESDAVAPAGATTLVSAGEVHNVDRPNRGANLATLRSVVSRSISGVDYEALATWDRVVVTGGSGCVGTALLRLLKRLGISEVTSIANLAPTRKRVVPGVEYLFADITDRATMESLLSRIRPDLVVHLAGIRDPGLAERRVLDAVSANVLGTEIVMEAAVNAGVPITVAASTGKAMRLFTSDIYASSKQLLEYQVARVAQTSGMKTGCARFTHIVDNSLIHDKMLRWATSGQPIRLHGPNVDLFVQSAREASELLMLTARIARDNPQPGRVAAITDLGWPPVDLFSLAMDVVEETGSSSPIICIGFPPGYEEVPYCGTTDPSTAGDHSPLFNALEAARSSRPNGCVDAVGSVTLPPTADAVDQSLRELKGSLSSRSPEVIREHLRVTCLDYLRVKLGHAPRAEVSSMAKRGSGRELFSDDHRIAHRVITTHLDTECESTESTGSIDSMESVDSMESADPATLTSVG